MNFKSFNLILIISIRFSFGQDELSGESAKWSIRRLVISISGFNGNKTGTESKLSNEAQPPAFKETRRQEQFIEIDNPIEARMGKKLYKVSELRKILDEKADRDRGITEKVITDTREKDNPPYSSSLEDVTNKNDKIISVPVVTKTTMTGQETSKKRRKVLKKVQPKTPATYIQNNAPYNQNILVNTKVPEVRVKINFTTLAVQEIEPTEDLNNFTNDSITTVALDKIEVSNVTSENISQVINRNQEKIEIEDVLISKKDTDEKLVSVIEIAANTTLDETTLSEITTEIDNSTKIVIEDITIASTPSRMRRPAVYAD